MGAAPAWPGPAGRARSQTCRALAVAPPAFPLKAGEALGRNDPLGTSGMIVIGTLAAAFVAATGSHNDHDEHDKTRDESCHHPQPKPLVRFHRLFQDKSGVRDDRLRERPGITGTAVLILS